MNNLILLSYLDICRLQMQTNDKLTLFYVLDCGIVTKETDQDDIKHKIRLTREILHCFMVT